MDDESTPELTTITRGPCIGFEGDCTSNATYCIAGRIPEIWRNKAKGNQALECTEYSQLGPKKIYDTDLVDVGGTIESDAINDVWLCIGPRRFETNKSKVIWEDS